MGYRGLAVFKMAAVGRRLGFLKVRNFNGRVKMVNVRRCTKLREDRSSGCRFVQPWMTAWLVPWRLRLFHTVWCPPFGDFGASILAPTVLNLPRLPCALLN